MTLKEGNQNQFPAYTISLCLPQMNKPNPYPKLGNPWESVCSQ